MIEMGGKERSKGSMNRVYIKAELFNEMFETRLSDRNNKFFFDCDKKAIMRRYKGKAPKIEAQY